MKKLTDEQEALLYLDAIKKPDMSYRQLGKKYSVSHETARKIVIRLSSLGLERITSDAAKALGR